VLTQGDPFYPAQSIPKIYPDLDGHTVAGVIDAHVLLQSQNVSGYQERSANVAIVDVAPDIRRKPRSWARLVVSPT
jgi:hypothetical protein